MEGSAKIFPRPTARQVGKLRDRLATWWLISPPPQPKIKKKRKKENLNGHIKIGESYVRPRDEIRTIFVYFEKKIFNQKSITWLYVQGFVVCIIEKIDVENAKRLQESTGLDRHVFKPISNQICNLLGQKWAQTSLYVDFIQLIWGYIGIHRMVQTPNSFLFLLNFFFGGEDTEKES